MPRYYRVQSASRNPAKLLGDRRVSRVWVGEAWRLCAACGGIGYTLDESGRRIHCDDCAGQGRVEDLRSGVSVCRSLADLAEYLSERGANLTGDVVVVLDGEPSDDDDHDADAPGSPILIHPTAVVEILPVSVLAGAA